MTRPPTRFVVAFCLATLVTVAAVFAYIQYQRPRADAVIASEVTGTLIQAIQEKRNGVPFGQFDDFVGPTVVMYLESDTAPRVNATPMIRSAWIATRLAHQLLRQRANGVTQAPLDALPGVDEALTAMPSLKSRVISVGGRQVFSDATETVTIVLNGGMDAIQAAGKALDEQYAGLGLTLKNAALPVVGK
jgi:hypothetical protein